MKKIKIAPLLSSLKEKRRYLVFEILTESKLTFQEVQEAILKEATTFLGMLGVAKAGITFLEDWKHNKGIIRVANKYLDHLQSVFVFIREINKKDVIITSVGISGTLHKARNKFVT